MFHLERLPNLSGQALVGSSQRFVHKYCVYNRRKDQCRRLLWLARAVDDSKATSTPDRSAHLRHAEAKTSERKGVEDEKKPPYKTIFRLITALAAVGAGITGYLTLEKVTGGSVTCPASGSCDTILSSGYATVFGVPLSLLGLLAYLTVAVSAGQQASQNESESKVGKLAVLTGGTVLAATSISLLYLLFTQFPGQSCTWCLSSAFLSLSIFLAASSAFSPRELVGLAAPGGLTAAGTILFLGLAWSSVEAPRAMANIDIPYQATTVRSASSPQAVELAKKLKAAGAKMFGAFWCSHCQEQKLAFGSQAQGDLPYVECFPEGYRTGVQMAEQCKAAKLDGFPMWIINGHRYEGEQTFRSLETALKRPPAS